MKTLLIWLVSAMCLFFVVSAQKPTFTYDLECRSTGFKATEANEYLLKLTFSANNLTSIDFYTFEICINACSTGSADYCDGNTITYIDDEFDDRFSHVMTHVVHAKELNAIINGRAVAVVGDSRLFGDYQRLNTTKEMWMAAC